MKIYSKIWNLYPDTITENDYIWITGLGCKLTRIKPEYNEATSLSGVRFYVVTSPGRIEIETTGEKQESMLQLKYDDRLCLVEIQEYL